MSFYSSFVILYGYFVIFFGLKSSLIVGTAMIIDCNAIRGVFGLKSQSNVCLFNSKFFCYGCMWIKVTLGICAAII